MKTKLLFISMFWIGIVCFSLNTYVPDDNFEQALIDLGYDTAPLNNYVPTANIAAVTDLTINFRDINDLTGIEDFTSLTFLNCTINNLSTIDLTQNTLLTTLYCATNNLTTIDLSQNTLLSILALNGNNLNSIDVSQNTALTELGVGSNNLNNLNITQNTALTELHCNFNNLNNLDVSQNTLLTKLHCDNNNLSTLDTSQNVMLEWLFCNSNSNLSDLNLKNGNNTNISSFNATNNPNLTCIDVDDAAWSTANWTNIDPVSSFSEDCAALSTDEFETSKLVIYPNPIRETLTINLNEKANYSLINFNGQILKNGELKEGENTLNVSNLSTGLYFFKVKTDKGIVTKKLIKQ